jgi:hypothetical protein
VILNSCRGSSDVGTREKLFISEAGQRQSKIRVDHGRNYALFLPF